MGEYMRVISSVLLVVVALLVFVDPALAEETAGSLVGGSGGAAIIGMAIAVVGGALSQSKAISVALESIARNPGAAGQMFLPWLLALVFIESLVIYALVIALKIVGII
jgi:F-type H+-transporting ATPase subunit c